MKRYQLTSVVIAGLSMLAISARAQNAGSVPGSSSDQNSPLSSSTGTGTAATPGSHSSSGSVTGSSIDPLTAGSSAAGTTTGASGKGDSAESSPPDEFAGMDTDHDNRVSAVEYSASPRGASDQVAAGKRSGTAAPSGGFELHNNEGRPDRSREFRRLDTNHDGYLSRSELGLPRQTSKEAAKP